ncbi:MAG: PTS sugar transporter subunit IIA [Rhizobacter sp.]|nr:PTS sugar transporter subunit IIA [Chlorobiales bacterium]
MKLTDILSAKHISLGLDAKSKNDIIEKMLRLISGSPHITDKTKLRSDVLKREKEMSTGIGKNVALPHAKTDAVSSPVIAFATLRREVDFESLDDEPVKLVFLLASPEAMLSQHIKLLSRISRVISQPETRDKLILAASPEEVLALFLAEEKAFPEI